MGLNTFSEGVQQTQTADLQVNQVNIVVKYKSLNLSLLGGVYMRKLAPARVSYRHDFLILYRVYMMTGLFHISLFEGTLHVDKMHL